MNYFVVVAMFFWVSIFSAQKSVSKVVVQQVQDTSLKQLECLSNVIYYEAKDEPYDGQLAVATVVMNRVHHGDFPNSVCKVVYQRSSRGCQFSWVCVPHHITEPQLYMEAKRIALAVLKDHLRLPTVRYALFFHTTAVSPSWDQDMQLMDSIGVQLFYGPKKKEGNAGT